MALPPVKRIETQDVVTEGELDTERFIYSINLFFESVFALLNAGLRFGDNITSEIRTVTFTTSASYSSNDFSAIKLTLSIPKKPEGIIPLQIYQTNSSGTVITDPVTVDWKELTNGQISINFVTGLSDSTEYTMRVLIL